MASLGNRRRDRGQRFPGGDRVVQLTGARLRIRLAHQRHPAVEAAVAGAGHDIVERLDRLGVLAERGQRRRVMVARGDAGLRLRIRVGGRLQLRQRGVQLGRLGGIGTGRAKRRGRGHLARLRRRRARRDDARVERHHRVGQQLLGPRIVFLLPHDDAADDDGTEEDGEEDARQRPRRWRALHARRDRLGEVVFFQMMSFFAFHNCFLLLTFRCPCFFFPGVPGQIRTVGLALRRRALSPTELRGHIAC